MHHSSRPISVSIAFTLSLGLASHLAQQPPQEASQTPTEVQSRITTDVNEVLVPVVVRTAKGEPVGTLSKEDFQVSDDGKAQTLTGFLVVQGNVQRAAESNPMVADSSAINNSPATPSPSKQTQRYIVLVFDDLNLSSDELAATQKAASKLIETSLVESDTVAIMATSGTNSGLTRDRAKLQEAILKLKAKTTYRPNKADCPNLDYYQADLIENQGNGPAFDAAVSAAMICAGLPQDGGGANAAMALVRQAASRAIFMMEEDFRANLAFLRLVIVKIGAIPGQHIIILISPGFLTPTPEAVKLKSELVDIASRSNVTINAIDARGLYTSILEAGENGENPGAAPLNTQYRQTSGLAQENVMAELADGTGGIYLHHTNRMDLRSLFAAPQYLYLLSYSPTKVKANGRYHELKVKVRPGGLTVQARRGYFAPKAEKNK
jgi:VWFA-related protein